MKNTTTLLWLLLACSISSCKISSLAFYQVYKADSGGKMAESENAISYTDDNCRISYDLWSEGGDMGFRFYNNTDQDIYLNLEACFFILNGQAHNYYRSRVYSYSAGTAEALTQISKSGNVQTEVEQVLITAPSGISSTGSLFSHGYSTTFSEEKMLCIPSKTYKQITEYGINKTLFRDCDLFKYPTQKQVKTKKFTRAESPFVFSNRLVYQVGKAGPPVKIENEFFVSEITNYPNQAVTEWVTDEFCAQKSMSPSKRFKNPSPDRFYLIYYQGLDRWVH